MAFALYTDDRSLVSAAPAESLCNDLQDFAKSHVETSLRGGATGTAAVVAALTGHQLPAAAAIAAASGDLRLATLIVQVIAPLPALKIDKHSIVAQSR